MSTYSIGELLRSECGSQVRSAADILRMSAALGVTMERMSEMLASHGDGYIYSKDLVLPDRPANRGCMCKHFGQVVIIRDNGTWFIRTSGAIGYLNRMRPRLDVERIRHEREVREIASQRRTEALFASCQGHPCPKHQGRANSLEDIGKYVNRPRCVIQESSPERVRTIMIPDNLD